MMAFHHERNLIVAKVPHAAEGGRRNAAQRFQHINPGPVDIL